MVSRLVKPLIFFALLAAAAREVAADEPTPLLRLPSELIVLLAEGQSHPSPEQVVRDSRENLSLLGGLGVGEPVEVRFLIPEVDRPSLAKAGKAGQRLLRYLVLRYENSSRIENTRLALTEHQHVLWAGYDWPLRLSATNPNDPFFAIPTPPYLPEDYQWAPRRMELPDAWDYNKGHAYIGVVDTGIDTTHPDLLTYKQDGSGDLEWIGPFRWQYAQDYGYSGDCTPPYGNDCNSVASKGCVDEGEAEVQGGSCRAVQRTFHGTHVSGILAAATDNSIGVAGTCWNCSLIVAKASRLQQVGGNWSNSDTSQANVAAAITGAVSRGAQILNLSLGWNSGDTETPPDCGSTPSNVLCTAIEYASDRDVVIAAASGNDGANAIDFPASDSRAIAVGGLDTNDEHWDISNYDDYQLLAPAPYIYSTNYRGISWGGGTCPGSTDYGICQGTSMATPQIAGSAGILRSVNPLLSAANIKDLLIDNVANAGGWNPAWGYGTPHIENATKDALGVSGGTQLPNRLTPLFSLYSSTADDLLYTTVPQMAAEAIDEGYATVGTAIAHYTAFPDVSGTPRASVYILTGHKEPFGGAPTPIPLYRLTYPAAGAGRETTYAATLAEVEHFNEDLDYEIDGIEGYIYPTCSPEPGCMPSGTVKLLRRFNDDTGDWAIFPESELLTMLFNGFDELEGLAGTLGYVYANSDTDGDWLVDGFELLAGTNLQVEDSDCDGDTDGEELLVFGAGGYEDPMDGPCEPGAARAAQFISMSVPTDMVARRLYEVSVTYKNVGTDTWTHAASGNDCNYFRLGSVPHDTTTWGFGRVQLPSTVAPGATVTIPFTVVAPDTAGTYDFQWDMIKTCVAWFGQRTPNVEVDVSAAPSLGTQVVSQTVPTTMTAGQTYGITMRLRNVGTTTWSPVNANACNTYRLGSWNAQDNSTWGALRHEIPSTVAPGGEVTLSFNVTAPVTPGNYNFQRRVLYECVQWFGDASPNVVVTVN